MISRDDSRMQTVHLPHSMSDTKMFSMYEEEIKDNLSRSVSRTTFDKILKDTGPNIRKLSLRSDMFTVCTQFQSIIGKPPIAPDNTPAIDEQINAFKEHRRKDRVTRQFHKDCVQKAKNAYKNRTYRNGKEQLSLLVVSCEYAEDLQAPSHCDEEGSLYFLSPLRLSMACATDQGSKENMLFLMPENKKIHKCGSGVVFLKRRNCTFDELIVFVDSTVAQNKNTYLFSMFSMLSAKKMFGCSSFSLSFLCVGYTRFSPD